MEINVTKTPTTGEYQDDRSESSVTSYSYVIEHGEKISHVIDGAEVAWTTRTRFEAIEVWGAVGNDLADNIEVDNDVEVIAGKAYVFDGKEVRLSKKYAEKGFIGIVTEVASLTLNNKDDSGFKLPVAVSGFVPAFVDKEYQPGTALVCSKDGVLTKASFFTKVFSPESIVGTYYKKSRLDSWNGKNIKDKFLVKVK
jgi:hypothetical protein